MSVIILAPLRLASSKVGPSRLAHATLWAAFVLALSEWSPKTLTLALRDA